MYISSTVEKLIISIMAFVLIVLIVIGVFSSEIAHFYYDNIEPMKNEEFHKISDEYNVYLEVAATPELEDNINAYITYALEKAPLYKNDYYIVLTNHALETSVDYAKGYRAAGITNNSEKKIHINYLYLDFAFLHEIGHAVDNTYKFSDTKEFKKLYEKVKPETIFKSASIDEYMLLDIKEYFAENYKRFVEGTLEGQELIEYFDKIIKDYSD